MLVVLLMNEGCGCGAVGGGPVEGEKRSLVGGKLEGITLSGQK